MATMVSNLVSNSVSVNAASFVREASCHAAITMILLFFCYHYDYWKKCRKIADFAGIIQFHRFWNLNFNEIHKNDGGGQRSDALVLCLPWVSPSLGGTRGSRNCHLANLQFCIILLMGAPRPPLRGPRIAPRRRWGVGDGGQRSNALVLLLPRVPRVWR